MGQGPVCKNCKIVLVSAEGKLCIVCALAELQKREDK